MISPCDACLRRALLIAMVAGRIAGLLERPGKRVAGLLALPERELLEAVGGERVEVLHSALDRRDLDLDRARFEGAEVTAVCRHSGGYPPLLAELEDPPAVLFVMGRRELLGVLQEERLVAMVGTRNPSPYGREVAHSVGRGLGAAGVPIVSGLALGIDAISHKGCLAGGGMPVAVLACGPDVIYPRRHRALYERILERGLVISELPPGVRPFRWSFPARNRIMAGLARMTLVVEAADPSGSLITSDFARDLGRLVGAIPGHVTSRLARGTNALLRDGAVPVTRSEDVLDELFGAGMRQVPTLADDRPGAPEDLRLQRVLEATEDHESVSAIAARAGAGLSETRAALGRLEAEGWVVRGELGGWQPRLDPRRRREAR